MLAFWPRRDRLGFPVLALLLLTVLYVVPVVALNFTGEFVRGAVFTLLVVAFLRLEKLRRTDAPAAAALALGGHVRRVRGGADPQPRHAVVRLRDVGGRDLDVEVDDSFTWDHTYDGPELAARRPRTAARARPPARVLEGREPRHLRRRRSGRARRSTTPCRSSPRTTRGSCDRWTQKLQVSIRNLRTDQFITAGYAIDVDIPRLNDGPDARRAGASRRARCAAATPTPPTVYTPRPSENQRRRSSVDYDASLNNYTTVIAGRRRASPARRATPARSRSSAPTTTQIQRPGRLAGDARAAARSAPAWRAPTRSPSSSSRTRARPRTTSRTCSTFLGNTAVYTYSETPPPASRTLDGFLFESKQGYCQQFSGAMALLLRMAGIPARVTTGFSTGATDTKTGEYIVRDFDAHSWVEAYYPDYGWITFDPTPAASPARSPARRRRRHLGLQQRRRTARRPGPARPSAAPASPSRRVAPLVAVPAVRYSRLLGAAALGFLAVRRWRHGAPPALSEFERALKRTRRTPAPGTTLHALELSFAGTPAAAGYVRALRESRYRDAPARPTRAQRRGLRSELGRGGGVLGRVRAWWALPPR